MSSAPIRSAVIGYGLAGRVFHSPFIAAVPGLELSAIVQRRGDTAAAAYPGVRILRSVDDVFADPAIDLVVVGTPNETHFDFAQRALEAGKHVVIDKPFSGNSAEARTLINLADEKKKVLAPFHNRRFDGDFQTVRKLVTDRTLGRITQVISHFDRFRPIPRANSWKEVASQSNGLLFDIGSHLVDQSLALFGPPTHITASVRFEREGTRIDDAFDVVLRYNLPDAQGKPRGLCYEAHSTMIAADPAPRFRVHGASGSYTKYGLDPQEAALNGGAKPPSLDSAEPWLPEADSTWGTLTLAPNPAEPAALTHTKVATIHGDYRLFYANVRDAIRGDAPLAVPTEDGFRTVRLLELAFQSSREQRTLAVDFSA